MCTLDEGLALPHPPLPALSLDAPPPGLYFFEQRMIDDPRWQFALALTRDARLVDFDRAAPNQALPLRALALMTGDKYEAEVLGHWLEHEVDPVDWLQHRLEQGERHIVSLKSERGHGGIVADAVVRWSFNDAPFTARYVASKWDNRMFVAVCRSREADYAELATRFAAIGASLFPLDRGDSDCAETIAEVEGKTPMPWKLALPKSWSCMPRPEHDDGSWFEAVHRVPSPPGETRPDLDGRLAMAVFSRQSARRPRDAANVLLNELRDNDIALDRIDFEEIAAPDRFMQAWDLKTRVRRDDARGELRARVLMHRRMWVVSGVIGPTRDHDAEAWMRNKRALDMATTTLTF